MSEPSLDSFMDAIRKRQRDADESSSSGRSPRPRHARLVQFLSNDAKRRELVSEGIRFSYEGTELNAEAIHRRLAALGKDADAAVFVWKPTVESEVAKARAERDAHWRKTLRHKEREWKRENEKKAADVTAAVVETDKPVAARVVPEWEARLLDTIGAARVAEITAAQDKVTKLLGENQQLQTKVAQRHDDQKNALALAVEDATRARNELTGLKREHEAVKQTNATRLREVVTLRNEWKKTVQERDSLKLECTTLTQEIATLKSDQAKAVQEWKTSYAAWKAVQHERDAQKAECAKAVTERDTCKRAQEELRLVHTTLQQQRAQEHAAHRSEVERLTSDLARLRGYEAIVTTVRSAVNVERAS